MFSEDEESAQWFKSMIEQKKDNKKRLSENITRNKDLIIFEKSELLRF